VVVGFSWGRGDGVLTVTSYTFRTKYNFRCSNRCLAAVAANGGTSSDAAAVLLQAVVS